MNIKFAFLTMSAFICFSHCQGNGGKKDLQNLFSCPEKLSSKTILPKQSVLYGNLNDDTLIISDVGITYGFPADSTNPVYADEILDWWEPSEDGGDTLITEYSADRKGDFGKPMNMCLKCEYFSKNSKNHSIKDAVVLLQEFHANKNIKCVLKKDEAKRRFSAVCEVH